MSEHTLYLEMGDGVRRALVVYVPERMWHSPNWQREQIIPLMRADLKREEGVQL